MARRNIIARLFGSRADEHAALRPLWHRVVELARAKAWYVEGHVADTVAGRFDAITLVLALVLLRMETDAALVAPSVLLTEMFVDDMDGQLREGGIGDLVVGKHVGRLMGVLGGRLGAVRSGLASGDPAVFVDVIGRNVTFAEVAAPGQVAAMARSLVAQLAALGAEALLAGEIPLPQPLAEQRA